MDVGRLWLDRAYQYADDVKSGAVPACKYVKLAVDRWFDDIENAHERGLFFSEYHAARYFRFIGKYCRHYQGEWEGKVIDLEPWQCFIEANLHGWIREDKTRRFRASFEEVARKNGKSTRLAAAGNYYLIGDNEPGAQVYSAATKRDQAKEIFDAAKEMLDQDAVLRSLTESFRNEIRYPKGRSKFLPLSKDSKRMDGFNVHAGLVDEVHAHPDSSIWDVLESARGARRQAIMRAITTAGFNRNGFCYELRAYAIKVLERTHEDDTFFGIIFTLDDPEKWDDPDEWIKANPNLGVSVKLDDLETQFRKAQEMPSAKVEFRTKRLNIWEYGETLWMPMDKWQQGHDDSIESTALFSDSSTEFSGAECYGGLDLASVEDLCAFYLNFVEGDKRILIGRAYLPQAALERRLKAGDRTLEKYKDSGHLIVTPGEVADYAFIKQDILQACEQFDVRGIAFDRWNSSQLVQDLMEQGVNMVQFGQGFGSMNAPMKELMRLVLSNQVAHNDPLLTWAVSNLVAEINPAGDIKPNKAKVSEKIDPAVAAIMAIALGMEHEEEQSIPAITII